MKSKWENEKENLEKLILEDNLSYEEIGRKYNCSGSNIKKVAIRLDIELFKLTVSITVVSSGSFIIILLHFASMKFFALLIKVILKILAK